MQIGSSFTTTHLPFFVWCQWFDHNIIMTLKIDGLQVVCFHFVPIALTSCWALTIGNLSTDGFETRTVTARRIQLLLWRFWRPPINWKARVSAFKLNATGRRTLNFWPRKQTFLFFGWKKKDTDTPTSQRASPAKKKKQKTKNDFQFV